MGKENYRRFIQPEMLAVFVAVFALIASQLPPIYTVFQKSQPIIRIGNTVGVTHRLGQVQLIVPMSISNTGASSFSIEKIECSFSRDNPVFDMVVNSTYQTVVPNVSGRSIGLSHIEVFPGQSYYMQSICSPSPSSNWLNEQAALAEENARYLHNAVVLERCVKTSTCPSEVPSELLERMLSLFEENFHLNQGNYKLLLRTTTQSGESYVAASSVVVQSFHVETLRRYTDFYRTGGGNMFGADISPEPTAIMSTVSDGH